MFLTSLVTESLALTNFMARQWMRMMRRQHEMLWPVWGVNGEKSVRFQVSHVDIASYRLNRSEIWTRFGLDTTSNLLKCDDNRPDKSLTMFWPMCISEVCTLCIRACYAPGGDAGFGREVRSLPWTAAAHSISRQKPHSASHSTTVCPHHHGSSFHVCHGSQPPAGNSPRPSIHTTVVSDPAPLLFHNQIQSTDRFVHKDFLRRLRSRRLCLSVSACPCA